MTSQFTGVKRVCNLPRWFTLLTASSEINGNGDSYGEEGPVVLTGQTAVDGTGADTN